LIPRRLENIEHVLLKVPDRASVFTLGTALLQELEELTPAPGEKVVVKELPSAFAQTNLHAYLSGLNVVSRKLVLVGYVAHACVSMMARAASELGYDVLVVRDAVGNSIDCWLKRSKIINWIQWFIFIVPPS
jgi:nicotinamidase-related amidase